MASAFNVEASRSEHIWLAASDFVGLYACVYLRVVLCMFFGVLDWEFVLTSNILQKCKAYIVGSLLSCREHFALEFVAPRNPDFGGPEIGLAWAGPVLQGFGGAIMLHGSDFRTSDRSWRRRCIHFGYPCACISLVRSLDSGLPALFIEMSLSIYFWPKPSFELYEYVYRHLFACVFV